MCVLHIYRIALSLTYITLPIFIVFSAPTFCILLLPGTVLNGGWGESCLVGWHFATLRTGIRSRISCVDQKTGHTMPDSPTHTDTHTHIVPPAASNIHVVTMPLSYNYVYGKGGNL